VTKKTTNNQHQHHRRRINPLPSEFYQRKTETVAKELLGKKLCRELPNGEILSGYIVETEAYLGLIDKACHSYGGRKTNRTCVMYEHGGIAYVYLIYGMYNCLNVVSSEKDHPEAVLIRALEPCDGLDFMKMKSQQFNDHKILNGPGKLCKVLEITKHLNTHDLTKPPLWIEEGKKISSKEIVGSSRINIGYAEEWVSKPLRYTIKDSLYVSVKIDASRDKK
jgi:DNA-3-methyladenine glycosylase